MFYIFFSIVTEHCFIFLFDDNNLISTIKEHDPFLHSEKFVSRLNKILINNNLSLENLEEIYFVSDPNEQSGNRVSFSFVTTMMMLSESIRVFFVDIFEFQKGKLEDCFSVVSFGKKVKKYWLNCYENNQLSYRQRVFSLGEISTLNKKKVEVVLDFKNIDFLENFFFLKDKFRKFEN